MKKFLAFLLLAISFISFSSTISAKASQSLTIPPTTVSISASSSPGITLFADVIVYKFRTASNGTKQYRRWNESRNYWVDPYWITL